MVTKRNLGKLIRFFRKKKGLSLEALAKKVLKSQSGLTEIENGKRFPRLELLIDICEVLEVDLSLIILFLDNEEQLEKNYLDNFDFYKTIDYSTIKRNYLIDKELNEKHEASKKSQIDLEILTQKEEEIQTLKTKIQALKAEIYDIERQKK